jgi:hypothetical protein
MSRKVGVGRLLHLLRELVGGVSLPIASKPLWSILVRNLMLPMYEKACESHAVPCNSLITPFLAVWVPCGGGGEAFQEQDTCGLWIEYNGPICGCRMIEDTFKFSVAMKAPSNRSCRQALPAAMIISTFRFCKARCRAYMKQVLRTHFPPAHAACMRYLSHRKQRPGSWVVDQVGNWDTAYSRQPVSRCGTDVVQQ